MTERNTTRFLELQNLVNFENPAISAIEAPPTPNTVIQGEIKSAAVRIRRP